MSETIERARVVEALDMGVQAVVGRAKSLPRLTVAEHAELITLRTVAFLLDIDGVSAKVTGYIEADASAIR